MPALKNARHERFAQELAKGSSQADAYAAAGFKPSEQNACRLTRNDKVAARILELKEKAAEKAVVTAADIAQQLDEDRQFARELKQASAAVSASLGKAKVLGLIVNRIGGPDGGPIEYRDLSEEEIEARIAARMAELNGDKGD
jgi:hypothetical protein